MPNPAEIFHDAICYKTHRLDDPSIVFYAVSNDDSQNDYSIFAMTEDNFNQLLECPFTRNQEFIHLSYYEFRMLERVFASESTEEEKCRNNFLLRVKMDSDENWYEQAKKSALLTYLYYTKSQQTFIKNKIEYLVKELIDIGCDVDRTRIKCFNDYNDRIPIIYAAEHGCFEAVKNLLDCGASVNISEENTRATALMYASARGHLRVVQELISFGAEVNLADSRDTTPLMVAVDNGHLEVVQELLYHGADVNRIGERGITAFSLAIEHGSFEMVKALLSYNADSLYTRDDKEKLVNFAKFKGQYYIAGLLKSHFNIETPCLFAEYQNHRVCESEPERWCC